MGLVGYRVNENEPDVKISPASLDASFRSRGLGPSDGPVARSKLHLVLHVKELRVA
jgi:hypothetical protein